MRRLVLCAAVAASLALAPAASAASTFFISGAGYGHGIGMSQYGASGYALHGNDYRFILAHYYQGTTLGTTDPDQIIRVLISTGRASFSGATAAGGKKLTAGQTYSVRVLGDGNLGLYSQAGKKLGEFQSLLRATGPGPLQLAGSGTYRGAFEFRPVGGAVQTVDAVRLDDYVRGVVSAEMPSSWSFEALKAQAVAARTYAITSNVRGNGFQLYSDTRSQAYGGVAAEGPQTNAAVAATRGQIVTDAGIPVPTLFFSSSGGYTEDIQNVWLGSAPDSWLRGVPDPYDDSNANPYYRWSERLTMPAAARDLGSLVKGNLIGVKVTKQGVSPRVISAVVVGTRGQRSVTGPQLQNIFGLRSTYMMFSSISSAAGPPSTSGGQALGGAFMPRVEHTIAVLFDAHTEIHGNVFPAPAGAPLAVQQRAASRWRTIGQTRLGADGAFSTRVPHAGSYRIVYHGVPGPAVRVG
ncbi:MAG TPA: SpoIID/LytB domain-containing protein [Solirubrobacteraceae bacterium]|nr:SpoIID/LytB domain-containing protein [Solirubrobacteraceae bacterium]